jgi:hypothetical protein
MTALVRNLRVVRKYVNKNSVILISRVQNDKTYLLAFRHDDICQKAKSHKTKTGKNHGKVTENNGLSPNLATRRE